MKNRRATCLGCDAKWVTQHLNISDVTCPKCQSKRVQVRALAVLRGPVITTRPAGRPWWDQDRRDELADQREYRAAIGGMEDPDVRF